MSKWWSKDGGVEGLVLIFSCKNTKIATSWWKTIDRWMLEPTGKKKKKDTPFPGTKEKPLQDSRRGTIMLKSNPLPAGWVTHKLKKFSHCCKHSKLHIRLDNLGVRQRDRESQGIWLWRTAGFHYRTSPCAHQDPGERSSDPARVWARCLWVFEGLLWRRGSACCRDRSYDICRPGRHMLA